MVAETGACRYCGQMRQMEVPAEWDEETVNEAAVELCDCDVAESYTRKKDRRKTPREQ